MPWSGSQVKELYYLNIMRDELPLNFNALNNDQMICENFSLLN